MLGADVAQPGAGWDAVNFGQDEEELGHHHEQCRARQYVPAADAGRDRHNPRGQVHDERDGVDESEDDIVVPGENAQNGKDGEREDDDPADGGRPVRESALASSVTAATRPAASFPWGLSRGRRFDQGVQRVTLAGTTARAAQLVFHGRQHTSKAPRGTRRCIRAM